MSSEEERPIAENTVPKEVKPLTQAEFEAQMQLLVERARAAGLAPLQTLVHTYAKRGMAIVEGILGALEDEGDNSKKKGRK